MSPKPARLTWMLAAGAAVVLAGAVATWPECCGSRVKIPEAPLLEFQFHDLQKAPAERFTWAGDGSIPAARSLSTLLSRLVPSWAACQPPRFLCFFRVRQG